MKLANTPGLRTDIANTCPFLARQKGVFRWKKE
jgi:hypothetical protein